MAQTVPPMRETRVRSLGWEDPLDKEMATHSSILACKIPWMEEPGRLQSMGSERFCSHFFKNSNHFIWESFPGSSDVEEFACNGFDPWVGKIS